MIKGRSSRSSFTSSRLRLCIYGIVAASLLFTLAIRLSPRVESEELSALFSLCVNEGRLDQSQAPLSERTRLTFGSNPKKLRRKILTIRLMAHKRSLEPEVRATAFCCLGLYDQAVSLLEKEPQNRRVLLTLAVAKLSRAKSSGSFNDLLDAASLLHSLT